MGSYLLQSSVRLRGAVRVRESEELGDLGVDRLGGGSRGPAVDDLAFAVDQELLEVPLDGIERAVSR